MPKGIKTLIAICMVFHMLFIVGIINFLQTPEVIRCEILTAKYGHEFEDPELFKDAPWIRNRNIELKVLVYNQNYAEVYYIYDALEEDDENYDPKYPLRITSVAILWRHSDVNWKITNDIATVQGNIVMPYWWHNVN